MSEIEKQWFERGLQQGLLEGRQQEKESAVLNLLSMGLKESIIRDVTGISSLEEIDYIIDKDDLKSYLEKDRQLLSKSVDEISAITRISVENIEAILQDKTFCR